MIITFLKLCIYKYVLGSMKISVLFQCISKWFVQILANNKICLVFGICDVIFFSILMQSYADELANNQQKKMSNLILK